MNRVIYKNPDSTISVLIPTIEALSFATLEEIATKDVPEGLPFKLVKDTDLPDRSTRKYWLWDDKITPDGVGGKSNEFEG